MIPPCRTDEGCWIPPIPPAAQRALEIRDRLVRLHDLNIGDAVLRIYGADKNDLDLLAVAEDVLKPQEEKPDGNGSEMAAEC